MYICISYQRWEIKISFLRWIQQGFCLFAWFIGQEFLEHFWNVHMMSITRFIFLIFIEVFVEFQFNVGHYYKLTFTEHMVHPEFLKIPIRGVANKTFVKHTVHTSFLRLWFVGSQNNFPPLIRILLPRIILTTVVLFKYFLITRLAHRIVNLFRIKK